MISKINLKKYIPIAFIVGSFFLYQTFPIFQTESKIRRDMLSKLPVGTDRSLVWDYAQLNAKGIKGAYSDDRSWWKDNNQNSSERIGESRILASIVSLPLIDITVIWLFDEEDKLIEVYAWRTIDLL